MRGRYKDLYRDHTVIPITALNFPLWVRETLRDHKSQRSRPAHKLDLSILKHSLKPNVNNPVFVLGAPRSGTTFLGSCLSSLPEISYFYEPVITKAAVRAVYTGEWSEKKAALVYRSVYSWLMRIQKEPDLVFCEKTPGNCFIVPFLARTFRSARFIHIVRDGRDSAVSLAEKPWYQNAMKGGDRRDSDGYWCGPGRRFWVEPERAEEFENTSDRHRCIWLWRRYVEEAMVGSESIPKGQLLTIEYETLVTNPEVMAVKLLDFLQIENKMSKTKFISTVVDEANEGSVGRWRNALNADEQKTLQAEAGELLSKLGYF